MMLPEESTFAGFLLIRKRPSPCVPVPEVGFTIRDVEPVVQPLAHVPWNTRASSATCRSNGCVPSSASSRYPPELVITCPPARQSPTEKQFTTLLNCTCCPCVL